MKRRGFSLIELIVVLGILAVMIGMLLPAVQRVRQRSQEMVCKNNLHQLNMGLGHYVEVNKTLPNPVAANQIGGWSYEILPYIEQPGLHGGTTRGTPLASAPPAFHNRPRLMRCPVQEATDPPSDTAMQRSHYVLISGRGRDTFSLYDTPVSLQVPWATGPETTMQDIHNGVGPHQGGFFFALGFQQGVGSTLRR